ncbi:MAG: NAD(P)/FAD-dependent oxidoreductase, partial [Verrucomicrobia bacterium]|nr:NAD(P)/FAD-dependent oxidoreductase [Verrucomicrobiota bacterium]
KHVASQLTASGVELLLGGEIDVKNLPLEAGSPIVTRPDGSEMAPDLILVATGRSPNVESLGLEALGIAAKPFIEVDAQLRTAQRHIFAIGDVNGLNMLDSSATAQARVACEAITGGDSIFSSRWVPRYLDTDPPVAAVGWMEHEAEVADFNVEVQTESVKLVTSDNRTVVEPSLTQVKLIVEQQTRQLRGCVIIGQQASEVINVAALAIQSGLNARDISRLLLVHPSVSVAFQRCAAKFA